MTIVAIDGPAGSGKSTVSKLVAQRLGIEVLDTGAIYRAVTWAVLDSGVDISDADSVSKVADNCDIRMASGEVWVGETDVTAAIRGPEVSDAVSLVSAHDGVRSALRPIQRKWMEAHGGGVVEGRDIATVVFPNAEVKVYLDADPTVRARRRAGEGLVDESEARKNIEDRDGIDSSRSNSPLSVAEGAVVIDTTDLSLDQVVEEIVRLTGD